MNKITRVDLVERLNKSHAYLGVYIKRGQLIEIGGEIDLDNPINQKFLSKQEYLLENPRKPKGESIDKIVYTEDERKELITHKVKTEKEKVKKQMNVFALDEEKKQKEIEKLAVDIQIKELQLRKMEGDLLPFEIVRELVSQLAKHLISEFDNATDKILTKISTQTKMSPDLISESREFIKKENNLAQKKAVELTKKSIELAINEMKE